MAEDVLPPNPETGDNTIAHDVASLLKQFNELGAQLNQANQEFIDQIHPSEIVDEAGRFRAWAGNMGAHQKGRRSLDHRLRDASHIRHRVHALLERLHSLLLKCIAIITGDAIPWDKRPLEPISDSDSSDTESEDLQDNTELRQLKTSIHDTVTMLLRLTMTIQNPAPHDQFMNSAQIDTSHFEQYDISHVKTKLPATADDAANRLGKAISRRRQFFKYRELHHQKLAHGIQPDLDMGEDTKTEEQPPTTIASSLPPNVKVSLDLGLDNDDHSESGLTKTSFATSADVIGERALTMPPIPVEGRDGKVFECPFCYTMVSVRSNRSWRKHVYRDLRPYVCTLPNCPNPNWLYERRHDWFQHELQMHQRTWQFFNNECTTAFQPLSDSAGHPSNAHNTAQSLEGDATKKLDVQAITKCNLCGQADIPFSLLEKHIGGHQEQLALFALPSLPENSKNETDTNSEISDLIQNKSDDSSRVELEEENNVPLGLLSEGLANMATELQPPQTGNNDHERSGVQRTKELLPSELPVQNTNPDSNYPQMIQKEVEHGDASEHSGRPSPVAVGSVFGHTYDESVGDLTYEEHHAGGESMENRTDDYSRYLPHGLSPNYLINQSKHEQAARFKMLEELSLEQEPTENDKITARKKASENAEAATIAKKKQEEEDKLTKLTELIIKQREEEIAQHKAVEAISGVKTKEEARFEAKKAAAEEAAIEAEKAAAEEAVKRPPPPEPPRLPVKFKDAVGRKFSFPWNFCKTWKGMEDLIRQAFLHVDVIEREVYEGHYDLVGPDGGIILPQVWESVIQPDMAITMHMWPMNEPPGPETAPLSSLSPPPLPTVTDDGVAAPSIWKSFPGPSLSRSRFSGRRPHLAEFYDGPLVTARPSGKRSKRAKDEALTGEPGQISNPPDDTSTIPGDSSTISSTAADRGSGRR